MAEEIGLAIPEVSLTQDSFLPAWSPRTLLSGLGAPAGGRHSGGEGGDTPPLVIRTLPHLPTPLGWKPARSVLKALSFVPTCPSQVGLDATPTGTGVAAQGAAAQGVDLSQFGQWLVEQQTQLMWEMLGQQERF